MLVLFAHAASVVYKRGHQLGRKHAPAIMGIEPPGTEEEWLDSLFLPPWEWTSDEWWETVTGQC